MRRFLRRLPEGGGQVVFNPYSLAWQIVLDARRITGVSDGALLASWPDSSGFGRNAAQGFAGLQPTYRQTGSSNGKPLVDFYVGAAHHEMGGTLPIGGIDAGTGFSFYAYYTQDQIDATDPLAPGGFNDQIIWADDNAGGWRMLGVRFPTTTTKFPSAVAGSGVLQGPNPPSLGSHVMSFILIPPNGGTGVSQLYLDGTLLTTGTWSANPNTAYLLATNGGGNIGLHGKVGWLSCASVAHDTATRQKVENFLRSTWG